MEQGDKLLPVEIKSGQTVASDFFDGLKKFQSLAGRMARQGFLIYGGDQTQSRESRDVVPWKQVRDFPALRE